METFIKYLLVLFVIVLIGYGVYTDVVSLEKIVLWLGGPEVVFRPPLDSNQPNGAEPSTLEKNNASTDKRLDIAKEILIPAGEFQMGSSNRDVEAAIVRCVEIGISESKCRSITEDEKPLHTVNLDAYFIDMYEVTNTRYQACVNAGGCTPPHERNSATRDSYYGNPDYVSYPVIKVDWHEAVVFCTWAGKRLPTESEWEKAARGTDGRIYPWGNTTPDKTLANFNSDKMDTTKVGNYPAGASPYGVMDMAGNVYEWTADWYDGVYYSGSPASNPTGPTVRERRVLRSSGWYDISDYYLRSASRDSFHPVNWDINIGFRCVRSP